MTFELHLPTLIALTIGTNLLLGGFMGAIFKLRHRQPSFLYWSLSCLLFAVACILLGAKAIVDMPWLTILVGYSLLIISPLLIVMGLLSFMGIAWYRRGVASLLIGLIGWALLLAPLIDNPFAPRLMTALYSAVVFALAYRLVGQLSVQEPLPTRILRVCFATHAGLMLCQGALMSWYWSAGIDVHADPLLQALLVSHILLTVSTALCFPLLAFAQSEQRLKRLAEQDDLTETFNRRAFFSAVSMAFDEAQQSNTPLSVLMIDLDHFKKINDDWGHAIGDDALRLIGQLLRKELRERDIIGRIGGEEFAVVLPTTSPTQAQAIANRLCECIAEEGREIGGVALELSASIGGAHRMPSHREFANMLMEADTALYSAKDSGRNRVHFHQQPLKDATILNLSERRRGHHIRPPDSSPCPRA